MSTASEQKMALQAMDVADSVTRRAKRILQVLIMVPELEAEYDRLTAVDERDFTIAATVGMLSVGCGLATDGYSKENREFFKTIAALQAAKNLSIDEDDLQNSLWDFEEAFTDDLREIPSHFPHFDDKAVVNLAVGLGVARECGLGLPTTADLSETEVFLPMGIGSCCSLALLEYGPSSSS